MPAPSAPPAVDASWLRPAWPAPDGVSALMTTRRGGQGRAPYDGFNLGDHVGDDPADVAAHRAQLAGTLGAWPVFLEQVHGTEVVRLEAAHLALGAAAPRADAACTTEPGLACTVLVADCLPVLLAAPGARAVGAAHAGWRGLAAGVVERTALALCEASGCEPAELVAWLGACIGPRRFEVGEDVHQAFLALDALAPRHFQPGAAPGKWLADLRGLARDRLRRLGLPDAGIAQTAACTVEQRSDFFSFRRDRLTGRMAACIWIAGR